MFDALVTGADGFIGQRLVDRLVANGITVHRLDRSDGDVAAVETWCDLPDTRHVFHLAARSYVPDSWRKSSAFLETNVQGTQQALEYCVARGAKLTFVSAYLYGMPMRLPIQEDDPIVPNNPYALSKHLAEQVCRFYAQFHGVNTTIIRPFNVYGPGQRQEFLIPEIFKQVRDGREIHLKDLSPKRDYVYVDDLVDALIATRARDAGYEVFNIGSGVSYSVAEIVDIIQQVVGSRLPVYSEDAVRRQEISDVRADVSRARDLLNWRPHHSFVEGIEKLATRREQ